MMPKVITREVIEAHLKCKHKGHLKLCGEQGHKGDCERLVREFTDEWRLKAVELLLARQKGTVVQKKLVNLTQLRCGDSLRLDAVLGDDGLSLVFDGLQKRDGPSDLGDFHYVPILFIGDERIRQEQRQLLGLLGLIVGDMQGRQPNWGVVVHGNEPRVSKIDLTSGTRKMRRLWTEIQQARQSDAAPKLILNDHCPFCEFRQRCYTKAKADDDLSLLRGMSELEIRRHNGKGIFTVSQLSHTFRPRRRNRRTKTKAFPRSFALQALAIRENKVFIRGPVSLPTSNVSVFLDIEGVPDRNHYYLAGMLVIQHDCETRHSFWSDESIADQVAMFTQLLDQLRQYPEYTLFHFGSYDTRALKQIKARLPHPRQEEIDLVLARAVNVLSLIHSHVYFPTYSNSLKEIGPVLGHQWTDADATGATSVIWRTQWEKNHDAGIKDKLLRYNQEDCVALKTVVEFLATATQNNSATVAQTVTFPKTVSVDDLPPATARCDLFGKKEAVLPGFDFLNKCGYFEYQRQKVFIRTNGKIKTYHQRRQRIEKSHQRLNKTIELCCKRCPSCGSRRIRAMRQVNQTLIDLKYSRSGVKKWIVKYVAWHHRCEKCDTRFIPDEFPQVKTKYGRGLVSWCVYHNIACGQNMLQVRKALNEVFHLRLGSQQFFRFKTSVAEYFRPAYQRILDEILRGHLIHADETEVNLRGQKGYVWVLTNMEWVYFLYRDSRESAFLRDLLKPFNGVLVSDFFTGYDSLPCLQQKCLIHLLRDLNEDVFRHPFDTELMKLAEGFATLLRKVIETVDRRGLQSKFLRRHHQDVDAFFAESFAKEIQSDIARRYELRLQKYRAKLFAFLDHDGVPWNNNNAEHAIHAFARYRTFADGRFTEASIRDYLALLSLYQSCEYQGISFLDFLRTECVDGEQVFGSGRRNSNADCATL